MAGLPSPTQVSGQNYSVYEAWYSHVDPHNLGSIGALDAANFLKKSGLSSAVLGKIWDLSDPYGKGYLDKSGFFVALKLVSLAQNGMEVSMSSISLDIPPPNMGELPPVKSSAGSVVSSTSLGALSVTSPPPPISGIPTKMLDWSVSAEDKIKYDSLFETLGPVDDKLPGIKVKEVLMNSKLPFDTLGKIWDLSDIDHDGALSRHEFAVAMHLVYRVLDSYPLPVTLPPELFPSSVESTKRRGSSLAGSVPVLTTVATPPDLLKNAVITTAAPVSWVVGASDKQKYEALFHKADMDKDGFVSGLEIKDTFLQTGLPQPILAHIWNLCDIGQTGKLNIEQFALAMWLVQQKLQGFELPTVLSPDMIPPSLRAKEESSEVLANATELEQVAKEIESLILERRTLETEIAQKEADIRIKSAEVRNLQGELDTLTATLKQLENQKKEAQKRLDDLDTQRSVLDQDLRGVEQQIEEQEKQVRTLRQQADEQEQALKTQEAEVSAKKQELDDLRIEEATVEQQAQAARLQLEKLKSGVQETQMAITQVKNRLSTLREEQVQLSSALGAYDEALSSGDPSQLSDSLLTAMNTSVSDADLYPTPSAENKAKAASGFDSGKFRSDPFTSLNGPGRPAAPSKGADPFGDSEFFDDPSRRSSAAAAFGAGKDPFASAFGPSTISSNDPFGSAFGGQSKASSFGAFDFAKSGDADPFGSDPFNAPSSAQRAESPTPALPPKKAKQPPPRPAPPKGSVKGPQRPAPPAVKADPFAASHDPFAAPAAPSTATTKDPFGGGGFADFANFDTIFSSSSASTNSAGAWDTLSSNKNEQNQQHRYAALDFTEDPFKDVSITDPFASNGGDDPFALASVTSASGGRKKNADHFDAFSSDPFASIDANSNLAPRDAWNGNGIAEAPADPFGSKSSAWGDAFSISPSQTPNKNSSGSGSATPGSARNKSSKSSKETNQAKMSEMQQLAWAAAESVRLEQERRRRAELQENADLELAIALSKSEAQVQQNDRLI